MVLDEDKSALKFQVLFPKDIDFPYKTFKDFDSEFILLIFYSWDFTKEARDEVLKYSGKMDQFKALGCEIITCSTDSCFTHYAWKNAALDRNGLGLKYGDSFPPMIGDKTMSLSRSFGVLNSPIGICERSLFVLDSDRKVRKKILSEKRLDPGNVLDIVSEIIADKKTLKGPVHFKTESPNGELRNAFSLEDFIRSTQSSCCQVI